MQNFGVQRFESLINWNVGRNNLAFEFKGFFSGESKNQLFKDAPDSEMRICEGLVKIIWTLNFVAFKIERF